MTAMGISRLRADLGHRRKGPHDQPMGDTSWVQRVHS